MKPHRILGALLLATWISGCSATTAPIRSFSQMQFEHLDPQQIHQVYDAAEATMKEYFHIDVANRRTGLFRSVPTTEVAGEAGGPFGRTISSPNQVRRIAELRIDSQKGKILARCRVMIQQSEAAEHRVFASQSSIDDTPYQTPLQETQGLDDDRYLIWSTRGYDRKLERQLLAALEERVSRTRAP